MNQETQKTVETQVAPQAAPSRSLLAQAILLACCAMGFSVNLGMFLSGKPGSLPFLVVCLLGTIAGIANIAERPK